MDQEHLGQILRSRMILQGRLGLVTGGGSGIGREICRVFSQEGATVVIVDRNEEGANETLGMLDKGNHMVVKMDISDPQQVKDGLQKVYDTYGTPADHIVNCAGIGQEIINVLEMKDDEIEKVCKVNVTGTFHVLKYGARWMVDKKIQNGSIVNISSLCGKVGCPGDAAYAISKAGVNSLTQTAGLELAKFGIRVNSVNASYTETPLCDLILPRFQVSS